MEGKALGAGSHADEGDLVRGKRATAALSLLLLASAGCTDEGQPSPPPEPVDSLSDPSATSEPPPPDTETETDTETVTATTSPATKAEGPPELPPEAQEQTEAGAEAFVAHYFDLLNYGAEAPNNDALTGTAQPSCQTCVALNDILVTSVREKVRSDGPVWKLDEATAAATDTGDGHDVRAQFTQLNPASVDFEGTIVTEASEPLDAEFTFELVWEGAGWEVREIG